METSFPDALQLMVNLARHFPGLLEVIASVAGLVGLWYVADGLVALWVSAQDNQRFMMQRRQSVSSALVQLVLGGVLASLLTGDLVAMLSLTVTGEHVSSVAMVYDVEAASLTDKLQVGAQAILGLLQVVGLVAMVKGVITLNRHFAQSGRDSVGQAVVWLMGGVLAWNFDWFARVLEQTIGWPFLRVFSL